MTALLTPIPVREAGSPPESRHRWPAALSGALAGLASSVVVLVGCMAVGLFGWFASGAHGRPRGGLRVGADAWLLAHGSGLELAHAAVSLVPLGLTLFSGYAAFRAGRWAARTSQVDDLRSWLVATGLMAACYGAVGALTAALTAMPDAQPSLPRALLGGVVVSLLAGGTGLLVGSGLASLWGRRLPTSVLAVVTSACAGVLLLLAAASILLAGALFLHLGSAANVLSRLHVDVSGGLLYTAVVAAVTPNAVLLTGSYLLGPGFAVGAGTVVSPSAVAIGPVPAFPLLAALPGNGPTPWWTVVAMGVPVVLAGVGAALGVRRFPVTAYDASALRGLCGGLAGGPVLAVLVVLSGGSVGPGRMSHLGAPVGEIFAVATVAMAVGGLLGALAMTWWLRHRSRPLAGDVPANR